jgi:pyrroline-5-carboxylate reductase
MDLYTALIGSGPAYVFYLIESLLESSSELKMDEKKKKNMIASMIAGSAELALISKNLPSKLRENVTSPNGVTQSAIKEFEKNGMKQTIIKAIKEAVNKSKELGDN